MTSLTDLMSDWSTTAVIDSPIDQSGCLVPVVTIEGSDSEVTLPSAIQLISGLYILPSLTCVPRVLHAVVSARTHGSRYFLFLSLLSTVHRSYLKILRPLLRLPLREPR